MALLYGSCAFSNQFSELSEPVQGLFTEPFKLLVTGPTESRPPVPSLALSHTLVPLQGSANYSHYLLFVLIKILIIQGNSCRATIGTPNSHQSPGRGKARDLPTSQVLVLCYAHPTPHHTQLSKRLPCTPAHLILRVICFYFYRCECFPAQMYVCQGHDRCLRRPERGVGSPGTDTVESDSGEP